jgi:uncharacterized protein YgfB (UPF0149 family)
MQGQVDAMIFMPSYEEVEQVFLTLDSPATPAEFHGMLSAFLCAGALQQDGSVLIKPLLVKSEVGNEAEQEILLRLYHITRQQLKNFEFDFKLLLPDDEVDLSIRAKAMSEWCQGFMIGLKQMEIHVEDAASTDMREALQRFLDLAILDYDSIEIGEEDEKAFFEVSEYVRLSVVMIYAELTKKNQALIDCDDGVMH